MVRNAITIVICGYSGIDGCCPGVSGYSRGARSKSRQGSARHGAGGETFDVTVNFTAPADMFNAIGLTDLCPDGWNVTVDATWCTPNADAFTATGNKAEIGWYGEPDVGFAQGSSFSALYKVTVPDDASAGIYAFNGSVEYYVGPEGPYSENITGGSQVEVAGEGGIGVWWIVTIVVVVAIIVVAVLVVRRRGT